MIHGISIAKRFIEKLRVFSKFEYKLRSNIAKQYFTFIQKQKFHFFRIKKGIRREEGGGKRGDGKWGEGEVNRNGRVKREINMGNKRYSKHIKIDFEWCTIDKWNK